MLESLDHSERRMIRRERRDVSLECVKIELTWKRRVSQLRKERCQPMTEAIR